MNHAFAYESTQGLQIVTSAMSGWQDAASTHKTDTNIHTDSNQKCKGTVKVMSSCTCHEGKQGKGGTAPLIHNFVPTYR